ncbi:MAG: polysaccharide biosynthesis/export family protein [Verrucomicrobiota bacterium]
MRENEEMNRSWWRGSGAFVWFLALLVAPSQLIAQTAPRPALAGPGSQLQAATSGLQASSLLLSPEIPLTTNANLFTSIESLDDKQQLRIGDRVSFRVIEDKEDAKPLMVTDSGELDIPYLGRVKAADKTCQAVAKQVKTALEKELYYRATVILAIDQLNKKRGSVYLVGQIKISGAVEIPSDEVFTVSKAILRAGGFGEFADKKRVKITRQAPGGGQSQVFTVDLNEILEKGQTDKDLKLEPGDLIFVPGRLINF